MVIWTVYCPTGHDSNPETRIDLVQAVVRTEKTETT